QIGDFAGAIGALQRALTMSPNNSDAWSNLGAALAKSRRIDEALSAHDRAIALDPSSPSAHVNRASTLLLLGRFEQGWAEYEWRLPLNQMAKSKPKWDGRTSLSGKRLLL